MKEVRKARRLAERVNARAEEARLYKHPPLLELLNQRWGEVINGIPDPTLHDPSPRPDFSGVVKVKSLREIAQLHAQADNSDPFAYGRAMRYMRQGYALPSEVRSDAIARVHARAVAGITIPISKGE